MTIGEVAANKDAAVGLNGDGANDVIGTRPIQAEAGIHGTIAIHPGDMAQSKTVDVGERAADQQFARKRRIGGINGNGIDRVVGAGTGGKRGVQRTAGGICAAAIGRARLGTAPPAMLLNAPPT